MRITKITSLDKTLEMQIEGEDIAVSDVVHHELLKNEEVMFAGAVTPHPLLKKTILRVQTKKIKPVEAVLASCERASEHIADLLNEAKKAVGEKAGKEGV